MSEWWKERKEQSLERKAAIKSSTGAKPGDFFLIVTEGEVAEPIYFQLLSDLFKLHTLVIKPSEGSDPRSVVMTAIKEVTDLRKRKKYSASEPDKYDHVWAVIDTDVAVREGKWSVVKQLADSKKVKLAHSSPCFEFWILLHLVNTTRTDLHDGAAAKSAVKKELGEAYSDSEKTVRATTPKFIEKWNDAVQRAQLIRKDIGAHEKNDIPRNPSTDVDLLVSLLSAARRESEV